LPLGAVDAAGVAPTSLLLRHSTSLVDQSVTGPGAEISPYLFNDRDMLDDESLQIVHRLGLGELTLQYDVRNEALRTNFQDGETEAKPLKGAVPLAPDSELDQLELGQTQRSLVLRYAYNPTQSLHFTAATGYSDLSLFGSHIDPRFGFVWTPGSRTSLRFSVGTTYQSPLLPELVVPNPLPIVSGGYVSIGNPNLKPDHATEYDLGFDRVLFGGAHQTDISADVYRVNLRTPASQLLPPLDPKCGPLTSTGDGTPCPLSYPVNAGDGVFQGIELSAQRRLGTAVTLRASYAVHSSYLSAIPAYFQEGALVQGEQTLGLPLHKGTLSLTGAPLRGLIYGASVVYEGAYNELNRPPFATLGARLGYRFRNGYEIGVAGTNLSDVYAQRFTRTGLGVPYGGSGEVIATDAYALQGRAYALTLTRRF
jgi:outer membrane receptor protein involved in Fe transport